MNRLHNFLQKMSLGVAMFITAGFLLAPVSVAAAPNGGSGATNGSKDAICNGIDVTGGNCNNDQGNQAVGGLAADIINILSIVGGIIAVIMIVVGGFRYVISGGDSNATAGARSTIVYAVIGLVVIAAAQLIVHFVLNKIHAAGV